MKQSGQIFWRRSNTQPSNNSYTVLSVPHERIESKTLYWRVACLQLSTRETMKAALTEHNILMHVPRPRWCTDNAAMIGGVASAMAGELDAFHHRTEDRRLDVIASGDSIGEFPRSKAGSKGPWCLDQTIWSKFSHRSINAPTNHDGWRSSSD